MSNNSNTHPPPHSGGALHGLIVEDQALIGLSLEAYLEELGIAVGGLFVSEDQALRYLEANTPDFAILDYTLQTGPCTALAKALRDRNVPVIVYSGHASCPDDAAEFQEAVWIEKPASRAVIVDAILQAARPSRAPDSLSQVDPVGV